MAEVTRERATLSGDKPFVIRGRPRIGRPFAESVENLLQLRAADYTNADVDSAELQQ